MNIQQIKEKYTCLDYLGKPVKRTANSYMYHVPWRRDSNPSLSVTLNGKGWKDLGDSGNGASGDLIDLVKRCLNTNSMSRVCQEFNDFSSFPQPITFGEEKEKESSSGFTKFEVVKLQSRGLFAYLYSRKVNIEIAKQFIQEAHYSFKEGDSYLYALAYPNNKGGYELRSNFYKGGTTPKGITTHHNRENAPWVVFEGFMDMLSFATLTKGVKHNYVVLNSIVNVDAAIYALTGHGRRIYLCLDNDQAGRTTTRHILDALPDATDISYRYAGAKDVNDYLCQRL